MKMAEMRLLEKDLFQVHRRVMENTNQEYYLISHPDGSDFYTAKRGHIKWFKTFEAAFSRLRPLGVTAVMVLDEAEVIESE